MKQTHFDLTKFQETVLGFVGWSLYGNVLFGFMVYEMPDVSIQAQNLLSWLLMTAIWLPVIILPPVLFRRERRGLGMGIISAAFVSIAGSLLVFLVMGTPIQWAGLFIPLPYSWLFMLLD